MSADNIVPCPKCGEAFREYYEFSGYDSGVITVDYRGKCRDCGAYLRSERVLGVIVEP